MGSDRAHPGPLRRYLAGAVLVRLADEGARVGLVLLALERAGSAGVGGALVAALLVPHVVAAPVVGVLTDRARRAERVVALAALGFAGALAAAAAGLGRVPLPVALVVLIAGGACGLALTGALSSRLAVLVAAPARPRAFGLDSLTYNVSGLAGPALAGLLGGLAGASTAVLALAACAAAGAAVLATLPAAREADALDTAPAPPLRAGVLVLVRDRVLGVVTAASSVGQLGPGALPVVAAVVAARAGAPAAAGWLMSALAAGGLLGSLAWTCRPVPRRRAPLAVMAALVAVGVPLGLAAATPSLPLTAGLFALSGAALGPFTGALFTARDDHAPPALRAQVFALGAGLKTSMAAAGSALAGLVAWTPTATQLVLVGACPVLAGAVGALALSARRAPGAAGRRPARAGR
jgi:Major Facilitator Superfamily